MTSESSFKPHPYLTQPTLYIANLPVTVSDTELANAFEFCVPFRPNLPRDVSEPLMSGTIEFKQMRAAEKALATLHGRPVPSLQTIVYLSLSPFPPTQPPSILPQPGAAARLVKQLPEGYSDSQLYDLFRPFGPLASVRTQGNFGKDAGVVEFWMEEDAKLAETTMHCAEIEGNNIAVQVYQPRRTTEFSPTAPAFVPSGSVPGYPSMYPSPPRSQAAYSPNRQTAMPFVHGPGQQVQFAPLQGPGSTSHSGLIDPCNLFCKNLDPDIDSNALFAHFRRFGQIVSARVMRDDNGRSRGFGFVSYQMPDQAATAMHAMNGIVLGQKQLIVRLHEPKQLRQEKLAARFGGHNGHPRSRSGATSPTASEGGESFSGWPSPRGSFAALGSGAPAYDRPRRSSGSYYNAALAGHLSMSFTYDDLSALSPVVRKEILTGELHRRVKGMENMPTDDVDIIVDSLVGLTLNEVVDCIHDHNKLAERVDEAQAVLAKPTEPSLVELEAFKSPSPAGSQDSRLLDPSALNATASAPEHPSTPVSLSASLSTPPRTSSPGGSLNPSLSGASERERIMAAVERLEPSRAIEITDLLMSLSKRERAMCLFNVEVLRAKVSDAKAVLETDDTEEPSTVVAPEPVTPVKKATTALLEDSPQTPELSSSHGPSAAASPAMPLTPSVTTHSIASLARMPAARIIELTNLPSAGGLPLPKPDPLIVKATNDFIDSLANDPITKQKQQLGDKLFRIVKSFGVKGAPKLTIALLDTEDLRALAHLMNSYQDVLKEKVLLMHVPVSK